MGPRGAMPNAASTSCAHRPFRWGRSARHRPNAPPIAVLAEESDDPFAELASMTAPGEIAIARGSGVPHRTRSSRR